MRKKYARFLGIVTSFVMLVSTMFASGISAKASQLDNAALFNAAKSRISALQDTQSIKDKAYAERENYMKNANDKIERSNKYFNDNGNGTKFIDGSKNVRVIVELDGKAIKDMTQGVPLNKIASSTTLKESVLDSQSSVKSQIQKLNPEAKIRNSYYAIMNGFSVETKAKDIDAISEMPGVKRVSIANEYYPAMNTAKDLTNVTKAWECLGSGNGYKGQGMVIAIVDSGIDPTHKDMRLSDPSTAKLNKGSIAAGSKGIYFTPKVPYGYNFADKSDDIIDKNPNTGMHGMHVAGIVAANCASDEEVKANKGIRGVAPEAQLLAMKVFSNNPTFGSAFSDDIIAAIDDSVAHGADVINMSLGSPAGYVDDKSPEQIAVNNATENGVVVAVAAGNEQYSTAPYKLSEMYDTGIVGSPATAKSAFMVASYENTNVAGPSIDYAAGSNTGNAYYTTSEVDPVGVFDAKDGYELVDCGIGDNGSATGKDDFEGKDLKGKIALIQRGTTTFIEKKQNAQAAGAAGVIVYNRAGDNTYLNMATDASVKIPAVFVNNADGVILKGLISSGLRVHFNGTIVSIANSASGNMSDFSSWGPTPEIDLRPQISAPGGNIWSTVNNNKYENMSGTSMATPHVAGLSALVMQYIETKLPTVTGNAREELAKTLLINTAKVSIDPGAKGLPFSPRRQGAGLADVNAAVHNYVTALCEGEAVASLHQITPEASGDTARTFEVTLHNYGTNDATYNVKSNYSVMTEQSKNTANMSYDVALTGAKVTFDDKDSESITVLAGKDVTVKVTLTIPQTAAKDNYAEGFITFESSDANVPSLGMPYMGFYGDWNDEPVMDAPIWDPDNSVFMAEGVGTKSGDSIDYLGFTGDYDDYGNPIIDKDAIGINPSDIYANNNAIPILSYLRSAKDNVIEIVDSKGKVVRQIAKDFNMRKSSAKETTSIDSAWAWNGTVYNSKTGKYDPAPDGQYFIQVRNKLDYGTSGQTAEQTFQMPVKVDSVAPQVSDLSLKDNGNGNYSLRFKSSDNDGGTKLQGFVLLIDNDIYRVDGKGMQKLQPDKDGYYTFDMNINGGHHIITVAAFDYAGNAGFEETEIANLVITEPYSNSSFNTGEFDVKFEVNPSVLDSISHYTVAADPVDDEDGSKVIILGDVDKTKTSYRVTGLDPGDYFIIVAAIPSDENAKIAYADVIRVKVNQPQKLGFTVKNLEPGSFISTSSLDIVGSFQTMPDVFKININDGTAVDMLNCIDKDTLKFNTAAATTPLTLSAGLNKVHFYAELYDKFGRSYDKVDYSINVYGAFEAPSLNITTPSTLLRNNYVDYVGSDVSSYTVKGNVEDTESGMGYRLYVNGNQIETVSPEVPETAKSSYRDFEYKVPLNDKVTNIKVDAVNLAGIGVSKNIVISKLDYPEVGIDFDNLSEGATFQETNAFITGCYNVNAKPKSLSINGQAAVFAEGHDAFSVPVTLTPGANIINVKAIGADDKTTLEKSFNVTCIIPDSQAPEITIENIDLSIPGTSITVKKDVTSYELKGSVTDDNPGIAVNVHAGALDEFLDYNDTVTSDTTSASFDFNIPIVGDYEQVVIEAVDKASNNAKAFVNINRENEFTNAGIFFDKKLNGAIFPSKEVRFSGLTEKPLEYFTIGGKNVPMAQDGTFAVDLPLDEGINSVEITAKSAIAVSQEVTTDAAIDTTGGAIDTTGGAIDTTGGAIDTTGGTTETTTGGAVEAATDSAIKIDEFVKIICDTTLPEINIAQPADISAPIVVPSNQDNITVTGTAIDATGLQLFTVNGKNVALDKDGNFTTDVSVKPGYNKISIIAEDMAGNYNFANINVNRLSTEDTSLESIKINGIDVEGFRPDILDYTFVVAGTIDKVPEVSFIIPYSKISKEKAEITNAAGIPGTTEIKVTSEGGKVNTYKIHFINAVNIQKVQPTGNGLQIGHDATVAFNASNATNNDQDATLIVALYDSNNKFVTFAAAHQVIAPKGSTQLLALLDMPDVLGNGYKVKCFVWDTLSGMEPLSKVIELQVSR